MSKHLAITTRKQKPCPDKEKQREEFGRISKIGYKSEKERKKKRKEQVDVYLR